MQLKLLNREPILVKNRQIIEPTLFETIKIENGKIYNLSWHQKRVDKSFIELFKVNYSIPLKDLIINYPKVGLYRAKLIYNISGVISLNYYNYEPKKISNIAVVEMPNINYRYKFLNRDFLNRLSTIYISDEFLITQNGYLKDTTIANIALFSKEDKKWYTPKEPLLFGTTLNRYLKSKKLVSKQIHYKDLKKYSKIAFLNAMIDWQEYIIDIN